MTRTSAPVYLGDARDRLTPEQAEIAALAVNRYGTGQHPYATPATLRYVAVPYLRACLAAMAADHRHVRPEGRRLAAAALAVLAAVN